MKSTLVSVILPVYNGEKFIRQTIDSLLAQDYENMEIIISDDGSTDSTSEIIKSYGSQIIYLYKKNGGCSSAYNFALEKSQGNLIALANYDDLWRKDKISKQVKRFKETGSSLIYTDHVYFSENDFTFDKIKPRNNSKIKKLRVEEDTFNSMIQSNFIACASVMISRISLDEIGLFDASLPHAEDYDMWLRLATEGHTFQYIDEILTSIRRHPENKSGNYERMLLTKQKIKDKICSQNNISEESQIVWEASILSDYANGLFKARKFREYRKTINQILKLNSSTLSQKQIKRFFTSFIK